jgi:protease II
MAYTLDLKGDEVYKLYVKNVTWAGGKAVKTQTLGPINNVAGSEIVWANDNTTFFCITQVGCL